MTIWGLVQNIGFVCYFLIKNTVKYKCYPDTTSEKSIIIDWFAVFKRGRTNINDAPRFGRPKGVAIQYNIKKVYKIVLTNNSLKKWMLCEPTVLHDSGLCLSLFWRIPFLWDRTSSTTQLDSCTFSILNIAATLIVIHCLKMPPCNYIHGKKLCKHNFFQINSSFKVKLKFKK